MPADIFRGLWLVKDFGVSFDAYIFRPDTVDFAVFPNSTFTNCQGNLSPVGFTGTELRAANRLLENLHPVSQVHKMEMQQPPTQSSLKRARTRFLKRTSRILKAFSMLDSARTTPDLGLKIAHYCSCFEILFSTSKDAIARSIGERLALTIGHAPEERMRIFNSAKEAYRIRCNVLHGTFLSEKDEANLEESSTECDEMLRRVITGMISVRSFLSFYANAREEDLDDYFRRMLFGFPAPQREMAPATSASKQSR